MVVALHYVVDADRRALVAGNREPDRVRPLACWKPGALAARITQVAVRIAPPVAFSFGLVRARHRPPACWKPGAPPAPIPRVPVRTAPAVAFSFGLVRAGHRQADAFPPPSQ